MIRCVLVQSGSKQHGSKLQDAGKLSRQLIESWRKVLHCFKYRFDSTLKPMAAFFGST